METRKLDLWNCLEKYASHCQNYWVRSKLQNLKQWLIWYEDICPRNVWLSTGISVLIFLIHKCGDSKDFSLYPLWLSSVYSNYI